MEIDGRSTGYVLTCLLKGLSPRREARRAAGEMEGVDLRSRARERERARELGLRGRVIQP